MLRVRLLALGIKRDFKDLLGYGCWCIAHGENPLLAKRGLPADDIDR